MDRARTFLHPVVGRLWVRLRTLSSGALPLAATLLATQVASDPANLPSGPGNYEILEHFRDGEVVGGQILCLDLSDCHVILHGLDFVFLSVDVAELSETQQTEIWRESIKQSQWGCEAKLAINPSRSYELRLRWVQFETVGGNCRIDHPGF
jgi:hypothetical protein